MQEAEALLYEGDGFVQYVMHRLECLSILLGNVQFIL